MVTRHNLDLLRAVAVTTVLVDHTTLIAGVDFLHGFGVRWLGVFGVYLFFVHTCLVLMWSLERRPHTLDFYVRRVFRIYPLAMIMVLLVALSGMRVFSGAEPITKGIIFSNLLLVQNLWVHPNINGVLWSLPVELEMYLLLPMLFLFARRERTIWPFLTFWLLACLAAKASYGSLPQHGLYALIPQFLPGVIAYIGFKKYRARVPAAFFLLTLVALCAFFMRGPGVRRGWAVCLTLGLALPFFRDFSNKLIVTVSHYVAQYSYGIYLLHTLALGFSFHALAHHSMAVRVGVAAVLTGVSSVAAYHLVEHPMMRVGSRVANRLQSRFGTDYKADYGLELS